MSNYKDSSSIFPATIDYDQRQVPSKIANYSTQVREKIYGKDVREALARSSEIAGIIAEEAKNTANATATEQNNLDQRFDEVQANLTSDSELIDARTDIANESYTTLKKRLDSNQTESNAKSTIHFKVDKNMQMQDIALVKTLVVNDTRTVCLLNVSSDDTNATYSLEKVKSISFAKDISSLVVAEMGADKRFLCEKIREVAT
ncbi:hypothetical protein [Listeria monocytogenes]|uniref:hypothetical protein n=1 Tax=Listeria monocytogenes TaxID=1639 RepID=UPI0011ECF9FC|nr:hypothetical protein [Listeria monocytogenes]TYU32087.1 hypothetical protein FZW87_13915 [Listeria monocytogenes]